MCGPSNLTELTNWSNKQQVTTTGWSNRQVHNSNKQVTNSNPRMQQQASNPSNSRGSRWLEGEDCWKVVSMAGVEGPKSPKTRSTNTTQSPNKHRGGASYYSRPDLHLQTPEILQKQPLRAGTRTKGENRGNTNESFDQ